MPNDALFRISLKCLIVNEAGDVLVVKETGRKSWDLPGGGVEHGDGIRSAIARELKEEVGYDGDFQYSVLLLEEPARLLTRDVWSIRIILNVVPSTFTFTAGQDSDEIQFVNPVSFINSDIEQERKIYRYATLA